MRFACVQGVYQEHTYNPRLMMLQYRFLVEVYRGAFEELLTQYETRPTAQALRKESVLRCGVKFPREISLQLAV